MDKTRSKRLCCAANVVTASEAREPDVYRGTNDLLGGEADGYLPVRFFLTWLGRE